MNIELEIKQELQRSYTEETKPAIFALKPVQPRKKAKEKLLLHFFTSKHPMSGASLHLDLQTFRVNGVFGHLVSVTDVDGRWSGKPGTVIENLLVDDIAEISVRSRFVCLSANENTNLIDIVHAKSDGNPLAFIYMPTK